MNEAWISTLPVTRARTAERADHTWHIDVELTRPRRRGARSFPAAHDCSTTCGVVVDAPGRDNITKFVRGGRTVTSWLPAEVGRAAVRPSMTRRSGRRRHTSPLQSSRALSKTHPMVGDGGPAAAARSPAVGRCRWSPREQATIATSHVLPSWPRCPVARSSRINTAAPFHCPSRQRAPEASVAPVYRSCPTSQRPCALLDKPPSPVMSWTRSMYHQAVAVHSSTSRTRRTRTALMHSARHVKTPDPRPQPRGVAVTRSVCRTGHVEIGEGLQTALPRPNLGRGSESTIHSVGVTDSCHWSGGTTLQGRPGNMHGKSTGIE